MPSILTQKLALHITFSLDATEPSDHLDGQEPERGNPMVITSAEHLFGLVIGLEAKVNTQLVKTNLGAGSEIVLRRSELANRELRHLAERMADTAAKEIEPHLRALFRRFDLTPSGLTELEELASLIEASGGSSRNIEIDLRQR